MVGRPRQFDPEQVLEAAMEAFWEHGYEATTVADLVAVTGLHKGSLYQAFGDKHALFCAALSHYLERMIKREQELFESASTPLQGLRVACHELLKLCDSSNGSSRGCLAVNSLVELAPHDAAVERILDAHQQKAKAMAMRALSAAQEAGEAQLLYPVELSATLLMTFMSGLAAQLKGHLTVEQGQELLEQQFAMLGLNATREAVAR